MKNVKMLVAVAMMGTAAMTITSCGKYEEGPGFTLLTKKARLTGEWDAKEYVDSDGTTIQDTDSDYVTFDKDGTYTYTSGSTSQSGTWEFSSDKEKIKVGYTVGSTTFSSEVTIVRLTNKELWTKDDDGDMVKYEKK
jgi:hypothetical protein